jgi:antitoxin ParD1/3/4
MERFVDAGVASGRYRDANDVVHDGLRLLERIDRDEALKIAELKRAVAVGIEAADRGQTVIIPLDEVPEFLSHLGETGVPNG